MTIAKLLSIYGMEREVKGKIALGHTLLKFFRRLFYLHPYNKESPFGLGLFLSRLFADEFYLPKPIIVVVFIVTIIALLTGFFIGFSNLSGQVLTDQRQANLQEFLHYKGGVL